MLWIEMNLELVIFGFSFSFRLEKKEINLDPGDVECHLNFALLWWIDWLTEGTVYTLDSFKFREALFF